MNEGVCFWQGSLSVIRKKRNFCPVKITSAINFCTVIARLI